MHKQIKQFLLYLKIERNYALNTRNAYARDLSAMLDFVQQQGVKTWGELNKKTLEFFIMQMRNQGKSGRSIRRYLSSVRVFLAYLMRLDLLSSNCAQNLRTPKLAQNLPKMLNYNQIEQMLLFVNSTKSKSRLRDRAMIEVLYSCALRVSELVSINTADIDWQQGFLRVMGKGGKMRFVPLGQSAKAALEAYLNKRETTHKPLFINNQQKRIGVRSVQTMVKKVSLNSGIKVNVSPHMLRHAAATHFLQSSHNLRCVQEFLGHSSIKSTQIYTHLDFQELAKVYDKYHSRAKR